MYLNIYIFLHKCLSWTQFKSNLNSQKKLFYSSHTFKVLLRCITCELHWWIQFVIKIRKKKFCWGHVSLHPKKQQTQISSINLLYWWHLKGTNEWVPERSKKHTLVINEHHLNELQQDTKAIWLMYKTEFIFYIRKKEFNQFSLNKIQNLIRLINCSLLISRI